jgi:hypothetical protein
MFNAARLYYMACFQIDFRIGGLFELSFANCQTAIAEPKEFLPLEVQVGAHQTLMKP